MRALALVLLLAGVLGAQRGGHAGGGFRGGFRGSARVGHAPGGHGWVGHRPGGSVIGGYGRGFNQGFTGRRNFGYGGRTYFGRGVPYRANRGLYGGYGIGAGWWTVPFFSYGYYGMPWYYGVPYWGSSFVYSGAAAYPHYTVPVIVDSRPASSHVIVINDHRPPAPRGSSAPGDPGVSRAPENAQAARTPVYLIASKSGVIWAAVAYWVEGNKLEFIGVNKKRGEIELAGIDRELTAQLNAERGVSLKLP